MKSRLIVLLSVAAYALCPVRAPEAGGISVGLSPIDLSMRFSRDQEIGLNFIPDLSVGVLLGDYVTVGFLYATSSMKVDVPGSSGSVDNDWSLLGGYALVEFLPYDFTTPFGRFGGGAYTDATSARGRFFNTDKDTSIGLFAGLGARVYLKSHTSASFEFQYHFVDLESSFGGFSAHSVYRVVLGLDVLLMTF